MFAWSARSADNFRLQIQHTIFYLFKILNRLDAYSSNGRAIGIGQCRIRNFYKILFFGAFVVFGAFVAAKQWFPHGI
jgi:hypothetical protein